MPVLRTNIRYDNGQIVPIVIHRNEYMDRVLFRGYCIGTFHHKDQWICISGGGLFEGSYGSFEEFKTQIAIRCNPDCKVKTPRHRRSLRRARRRVLWAKWAYKITDDDAFADLIWLLSLTKFKWNYPAPPNLPIWCEF